jgi:hypothetical protein
MNVELMRKIILDQFEEIGVLLDNDKIIDREIEIPISEMKEPNILSILGVRRCGKSTLALNIARELGDPCYVNFDDERLFGMDSSELGLIIDAWLDIHGEEPDVIVLDEIQNIVGWELFVNRMRRTRRVIITGSNANLLEGDLSTHLTGRYVDLRLDPFSFREYLSLIGKKDEIGKMDGTKGSSVLRRSLERYIEKGGFPEVHTRGGNILARIYKDILLKDAILRYGIRNRTSFNEVSRYLLSNYSREFTYSRIGRVCNISNKNMVSEYVRILEEVGLFFHLERYSKKISSQNNSPKKAYSIDTGLANTIGFNISENKGLLMENVVAIELRRSYNNNFNETGLYYWKDHSSSEVDFVIREDRTIKRLIQVSYSIESEPTRNRELRNLIKASDLLGCEDLLIITWNDDERYIELDDHQIKILPLYKWLCMIK